MKNKLLKKVAFKVIKLSPSNSFRVFIYKNIFKYKIGKKVVIGKSIINSKKVEIGDNVIIKNNTEIGCKTLKIGNNTAIHSGNVITGKGSFSIGENSRIVNNHYIDLFNDVEIGSNTCLAGKRSQIWTHGSIHTKKDTKDLSVKIGNDIYIGSNTCIAPGVKVEDINLIGLGSVLTKSITTSNNIVVGNPAEVIKENIDWRDNW